MIVEKLEIRPNADDEKLFRVCNAAGTEVFAVNSSTAGATITGAFTAPSTSALKGIVTLADTAHAGKIMGCGAEGATKSATTSGNFLSYYFTDSATSGDCRGMYIKLYLTGSGGSGEALRAFTQVGHATMGNAHGAHLSLEFSATGKVTGQAIACRMTLHIPDDSTCGGNLSAAHSEVWFDGDNSSTTDITGATHAIHRFSVNGDTTSRAKLLNVFSFERLPSGALINAGTGATSAGVTTGGVAAKVIRVLVDGVAYYMPLFSTNS